MVTDVVVVGAGYAGVMAANRLVSKGDGRVRVTVVNPRAEFVERIRLHQLAAGTGDAVAPLASVLDPRVGLRISAVTRIVGNSVPLPDGGELGFDRLVYAVGSRSAVREQAHTVGDLAGAQRLRRRLRELDAGDPVTVVGAGLTGVETAAEIAESHPHLAVRLLSAGPIGGGLPERGRRRVRARLRRLGVEVRTGVRAERVGSDSVDLDDGTALPSACTVWAGAFEVPDLARTSGLPVDAAGRLRTDESLVCVERPDIVGVGDAVAPPRRVAAHLRMSCQAAIPLGATGADTVLAQIDGRAPEPLSIGMVLQCISLGRRGGYVQTVRADDSARRWAVRGRLGASVKEQICRGTLRYIRSGDYRWAGGPRAGLDETDTGARVPS
ncbi:NAD(P)/FAD-dependent oxidoreductase [Speluncibacter jeojiensis]|uniref:FAD-dependent oxidoreductase n=1 Tax=Speluncibacter jeojiensis TaxID=2710754 RepID=A0A9X4LZV3_9ACTN|nr:FAD-dependent oxidoreductase [Corynebacteriales bacterium D3-21]